MPTSRSAPPARRPTSATSSPRRSTPTSPRAAAIVCHGGSGTVLGALAAGVPMVVTPLFADQPHNARRVAATGTGLALFPPDLQAETLRAAVSRVLGEPSFRDAAQAMAREI